MPALWRIHVLWGAHWAGVQKEQCLTLKQLDIRHKIWR